MQVEILSPEKKVFSGEADAVQFPGTTGSFQVLNNHAAMIASLTNGTVSVKTGKKHFVFEFQEALWKYSIMYLAYW